MRNLLFQAALLLLGAALVALETVFMFLPKSQNVGHSLAAQTRFRCHWKPPNQ